MEKQIKNTSSKEFKRKRSWSLSIDKSGEYMNIRVRELDGEGFIVSASKSGTDKSGKYYSEDKEYYSKDNPLETKVKPDEDVQDDIENLFDPFKALFK